jgi:hypothetical protein
VKKINWESKKKQLNRQINLKELEVKRKVKLQMKTLTNLKQKKKLSLHFLMILMKMRVVKTAGERKKKIKAAQLAYARSGKMELLLEIMMMKKIKKKR